MIEGFDVGAFPRELAGAPLAPFERGERVDGRAADPHLEVQVRAGRVAGRADRSEPLPDADLLAFGDRGRALLEVHERVPVGAVGVGLDDVVAGAAGMVVDGGDRARARGDDAEGDGRRLDRRA